MNKKIWESANYVEFCKSQSSCKTCPLADKGADCGTAYKKMKKECAKMAITRFDKIKGILEGMDFDELIAVWNTYCDEVRNEENVYFMEEFNEMFDGVKPWEIARSAFFGDFNPTHDYFTFNGYGNLVSFDYFTDNNCPIIIDDIAEFVDRTEYALDNHELLGVFFNDESGE